MAKKKKGLPKDYNPEAFKGGLAQKKLNEGYILEQRLKAMQRKKKVGASEGAIAEARLRAQAKKRLAPTGLGDLKLSKVSPIFDKKK